jgi:pseudaminic acid synthase
MGGSISIADRLIGAGSRPFIVAEMSGNHNQALDRALAIVEAAAQAGAHAIKLQTYTADTITLDVRSAAFVVDDDKSLWNGRRLYQLYRDAYTPWEWHAPLMERARALGMLCFSSPFDESAVDFLQSLQVPAYKIASFENNHLPLIRKAAATGKPLIISTGMATLAELDEAVEAARGAGCRDLVLLKCTSTYPASPDNTNVLTIPDMRARFECEIGLSDHTMGIGTAIAAVAHGAALIEKHFTLRRADGGVDSAFSLEPAELAMLVEETERAWRSLGKVTYGPTAAEQKSLAFRRSLYVAENMVAGEQFTPHNLRVVRPAGGLHPRFYEQVLGRRVARNVPKGTAVDWSLLA